MNNKVMNAILVAIALIAMALGGNFCEASSLPETPTMRIIDTTGTINQKEKEKILDELDGLHNSGKAEMVVVMIPSLDGEPIDEFTMNLAEKWKIGKKDIDNGILLVIAKNDHKFRLEIGRGLEGSLTDGAAGEVLDRMKPALKSGDFASAIITAVSDIELKLNGESISEESSPVNMKNAEKCAEIVFEIILIMWLCSWLYSAHEAKEEQEYRGSSYIKRLLAISVIVLATVRILDILANIFCNIINIALSCVSDSDFDSGGGFDGGGCSDDW